MDLILMLIGLSAVAIFVGQGGDDAVPVAYDAIPPAVSEPEPDAVVDATEAAPDAPLVAAEVETPEAPELEPTQETPPPPPAGFIAEDQAPSGKFTTAMEVKPILTATVGNWVGVREYNGQDLVYFTHLLAWRCGLHQISYALNDGPEQVFATEPCYVDTGAPNAIKADSVQPYIAQPLKSVQSVTITLLFDDLTTQTERYERTAIQIP